MNASANSLVAAASGSSSENTKGADARLRVRANTREFRLPLSSVVGVADCPALARVPAAPSWLLGVGGLHGRLLPVVDLAAAESEFVAPSEPGPQVLLVEVWGQMIGISVSAVSVEPDGPHITGAADFAIRDLAARLLKTALAPLACERNTD